MSIKPFIYGVVAVAVVAVGALVWQGPGELATETAAAGPAPTAEDPGSADADSAAPEKAEPEVARLASCLAAPTEFFPEKDPAELTYDDFVTTMKYYEETNALPIGNVRGDEILGFARFEDVYAPPETNAEVWPVYEYGSCELIGYEVHSVGFVPLAEVAGDADPVAALRAELREPRKAAIAEQREQLIEEFEQLEERGVFGPQPAPAEE